MTHNCIELEWLKPEQGAHNVTTYIIYGSTSNDPTQWTKRNAVTATKGNRMHERVLVTNLLEKTIYYFKVQPECAAESASDSEISDPIKTRGLIPSQPGKPVCSSLSSDSIQVKWSRPEQGAHNVIAYNIFYRSDKDEWIEIKSEGTKESIIVSKLSERALYCFKVQAECADGFGPESEVSEQIYTKIMLPSKPGKPKAISITHDRIDLVWTKPEQGVHNVAFYTVLYCSTSDHPDLWREQKTKATEEKAIVTGLSEKSAYLFKVRPESKSGEPGEVSDESEAIKTTMIIPNKPSKPVALSVTHSAVEGGISAPIKTRNPLILKNVLTELWDIRDKWYSIGAMLGLKTSDLNAIKHDNNNKSEPCLREMIALWLKQTDVTWEVLFSALRSKVFSLHPQAKPVADDLSIDSETDSEGSQDDMPSGEGFKCPHCGECSIVQYLKRECPKFKSSSDLTFPYLVHSKDLTSKERQRLHSQLLEQTEEIITKFAKFIRQVRSSFKQRIDPEELAASIVDIVPRESLTHSLDVKNVSSVTTIIRSLQEKKYISFFNFHIIQHLVDEHGTDEDKAKLSDYEAKFKGYCQRSVFEVPQAVFGEASDDSQVLAFKVTKHVTNSIPSSLLNVHSVKRSSKTLDLSIDHALTIKGKIARTLGIENNIGCLDFLGAKKGCVELNFSAPCALLDKIKQQHKDNMLTKLPDLGTLEINMLCGPPGKPYAVAITGNSINLQWSKPIFHGSHPIEHYNILCKSFYDPSVKWKVLQSKAFKESMDIAGLSQSKMPFIFKV